MSIPACPASGLHYRIDVVQQPEVDVADDIAMAEYEYIIHLEMKQAAGAITVPGALTAPVTPSRY